MAKCVTLDELEKDWTLRKVIKQYSLLGDLRRVKFAQSWPKDLCCFPKYIASLMFSLRFSEHTPHQWCPASAAINSLNFKVEILYFLSYILDITASECRMIPGSKSVFTKFLALILRKLWTKISQIGTNILWNMLS